MSSRRRVSRASGKHRLYFGRGGAGAYFGMGSQSGCVLTQWFALSHCPTQPSSPFSQTGRSQGSPHVLLQHGFPSQVLQWTGAQTHWPESLYWWRRRQVASASGRQGWPQGQTAGAHTQLPAPSYSKRWVSHLGPEELGFEGGEHGWPHALGWRGTEHSHAPSSVHWAMKHQSIGGLGSQT